MHHDLVFIDKDIIIVSKNQKIKRIIRPFMNKLKKQKTNKLKEIKGKNKQHKKNHL
jgi:hypothetical protein